MHFRLDRLHVCPLRERVEDIPALVHHFVERFSSELGVPRRWPSERALALLARQPWPGNVRELENVIKRALVLASGEVIDADDVRRATDASRGFDTDWTRLARREFAIASWMMPRSSRCTNSQ